MFSDSPGVQSCKKCIQIILFFCCAQGAKICSSHGTADENSSHWQLELSVNGLVNQLWGSQLVKWHVFWNVGTPQKIFFLGFHFIFKSLKIAWLKWHQSIHDHCQPGMSKKTRNNLHASIPVSPLDLSSLHSRKCHGKCFFCKYLNVWILWFCAFVWSPAQWKSAWTDAGKLTTFWYQLWVDRGWLEKIAA